jgi:Inovirus Coat protein B
MRNLKVAAVLAAVALASSPAFAVLDVTAATTGITDATVAVVTVLGALIVMGAAFFGLKKVKRLIGG